MKVHAGGFNRGVSEPSFQDEQLNPLFKGMTGKAMAKRMYPTSSGNTCLLFGQVINLLSCFRGHGLVFVLGKKQPFAWLIGAPVFPEQLQAASG